MKQTKPLIPIPPTCKPKFNILHFIFTPNLWFSDDNGDDVDEQVYPTENDTVNNAVDDFISSDKLHYLVESIAYDYKVLDYYFQNDLLHIIVDTGKSLSVEQLSTKLYDISPDGNAPDLWMEGDISVTENIEFVPTLYKLFCILGCIETEIDTEIELEIEIDLTLVPKPD